jgi:hypothetical protein
MSLIIPTVDFIVYNNPKWCTLGLSITVTPAVGVTLPTH